MSVIDHLRYFHPNIPAIAAAWNQKNPPDLVDQTVKIECALGKSYDVGVPYWLKLTVTKTTPWLNSETASWQDRLLKNLDTLSGAMIAESLERSSTGISYHTEVRATETNPGSKLACYTILAKLFPRKPQQQAQQNPNTAQLKNTVQTQHNAVPVTGKSV
jgi:hypothetical protein